MKSFIFVIIIWIFASYSLSAAEKLQLSNEDNRNRLVKEWKCNWKARTMPGAYNGNYDITIEDINGTHLTGKFNNSFCPNVINFDGEIKKNRITFKMGDTGPFCQPLKIKVEMIKDKKGKYLLKGNFNQNIYQYPKTGKVVCK